MNAGDFSQYTGHQERRCAARGEPVRPTRTRRAPVRTRGRESESVSRERSRSREGRGPRRAVSAAAANRRRRRTVAPAAPRGARGELSDRPEGARGTAGPCRRGLPGKPCGNVHVRTVMQGLAHCSRVCMSGICCGRGFLRVC